MAKIYPPQAGSVRTGGASFRPGGGGGGASAQSGPVRSSSTGDLLLNTAVMQFPALQGVQYVDWAFGSPVDGDHMAKGINWQTWRDAVGGMAGSSSTDIVESVQSNFNCIQYKNTTLKNFYALHNMVLLGNAPPLFYIQDIRLRGNGRPKIGLYFANWETVPQALASNPWWTTLDAVCLANLRNTGVAQSGSCFIASNFVDQFQTFYAPGCLPAQAPSGTQVAGADPHDWVCDMGTAPATFAATWLSTFQNMILTRYGFGGLDFVLVDNVNQVANWGSSAAGQHDAAITPTVYTNAWKAFWALVPAWEAATGTKMIGNCGISSTYTNAEVPRRYGEHFFHLNQTSGQADSELWTVMQTRLLAANGQSIIAPHHQITSGAIAYNARAYGAIHVDNWSGTADGTIDGLHGKWSQVRELVYMNGMQNEFYAVCNRGGTTFPSFWQTSFKRPGS